MSNVLTPTKARKIKASAELVAYLADNIPTNDAIRAHVEFHAAGVGVDEYKLARKSLYSALYNDQTARTSRPEVIQVEMDVLSAANIDAACKQAWTVLAQKAGSPNVLWSA